MNRSRRAPRSPTTALGLLAFKLLRLGWLYCCLGVLYAVLEFPQYLPRVLWPMAVMGAAFSFAFEFVLRVPDFPFWLGMQFAVACAALLGLHHRIVAAAKPSSR